MDIGCYAVNLWRTLSGEEPTVVSAQAKTISANIDRAMAATLATPNGITGSLQCSLLSAKLFQLKGRVTGTKGSLSLFNPLGPQFFNRITVKSRSMRRVEHAQRVPTYTFQMEAFRNAVVDGTPFPTTARDAISTMEVIDAIYVAAGLVPRQPTPA